MTRATRGARATARVATRSVRAPRGELVRGEPVVRAVLDAAIAELSAVGYHALGVDDVARRAGVARTTVYRRWPTKPALVRAAIEAIPGAEAAPPRTGSLRGDLLAIGARIARFLGTPRGLAVARLFVLDGGPDGDGDGDSDGDHDGDGDGGAAELRETLHAIRTVRDDMLRAVLREGVRAGELGPGADIELIVELLPAALLARAAVHRAPLGRAYLERLVDFLLARAVAAPRARARLRS